MCSAGLEPYLFIESPSVWCGPACACVAGSVAARQGARSKVVPQGEAAGQG